ncbi:hypothetical protein BGZ96_001903 [Linnemannia gamsii]|uniref:Uncharacterized protein n=1 Tax=Linnemannia gamsii TaxID=64522 RepID=A0ABQ7JLH2_9FUNG|nr:hypothetical protein BGZ96_001903 [Linnemannia gamsii]
MDSISPSTTATTIATNTSNNSPATSSIPVPATRGEPPILTYTLGAGTSIWSIIKESMSNSLCCGFWFVEPKVWLIEISLRECQLDEYAVLVPSPVYCDYRLPGYDDVMTGPVVGGGGGGSSSVAAAASSSRAGLNRYNGLPPAYESESDSEGEDEDHEDDDDDHEDDDLEGGAIETQIQGHINILIGIRWIQLIEPDHSQFSAPDGDDSEVRRYDLCHRPLNPPAGRYYYHFRNTTRPFPFNTYGSGSSQEYTHHDPRRMTQSSISLPSIVELSDTSK